MNKVRMRSRSTILAIMLICLSLLIVSISTLAVLRDKYKASDNANFGKIEISTEQNFAKVNSTLLDAVAGDKLTDAITISKSESSDPMYIRIKVGFDTDSTNADVVDYVNRLNRYDFGMAQNTTGYKWSDRYGRYYFLLDDADNIFSVSTSESITLTDSFTIPFAMAEMEENEQYFEHATFSVEIQAIQSAVVENLIDPNATPKAQLRAVDNVFAEVFGERAEILSTLSTDYLNKLGITDKSTVSSIIFYDDGTVINGANPVDLSDDASNTIIGYIVQSTENANLVDIHISSNQRIALPKNSQMLFSIYQGNEDEFTNTSNFKAIINADVLDTSKVTNMRGMFYYCTSLESVDVSKFDTSQVTDMSWMFNECNNLKELNVSNFDTSQVVNMRALFGGCGNLTSLDVSKFNTSNVTDMGSIFSNCKNITSLNINSFDTSKVVSMRHMFIGCEKLSSIDLSKFKTSNVTDMSWMFGHCIVESLNLSNFDTSNVENMSYMFYHCEKLTNLDISNFNTAKVSNMSCMFDSCLLLTSLDLINFKTSNVANMQCMFQGCTNLESVLLGENWNFNNVTEFGSMFGSTSKAKVFCVNAGQKTWLSDTSKNIIDDSRVFVKVSNSEVINALNSVAWGDLSGYTTIQTAEYNGVTYYKVKGKAGFYTL